MLKNTAYHNLSFQSTVLKLLCYLYNFFFNYVVIKIYSKPNFIDKMG